MGSLCIRQVDSFDALRPRREEWNALAARGATNSVFQTFEWHDCWWRNFGDRYELLLLVAEQDQKLVGVAPLMRSVQRLMRLKLRTVEFIGAPWGSDYCDLVYVPGGEVPAAMVQWLAEHDDSWDLLQLSNLPDTSLSLQAVPELLRQRQYMTQAEQLCGAPTRVFRDPAEDQKLPQKKSLKRHYNWFQKNGELEFRNCTDVDETLGYLDTFFQQHIDRRGKTDAPSQFLDARDQSFYRDLVRELLPRGWLVFSAVLFNASPIAFHVGFEFADRFIWYKPTFDVHWEKHSPGEVLIKGLLEYALARGVSEFDFTIGEEEFKYRYANLTRYNYAIRSFRQAWPYYGEQLWRGTKDFIKRRLGRQA